MAKLALTRSGRQAILGHHYRLYGLSLMHVFYRPEQVATTNSISRSALKPQLVVEDWIAQEFRIKLQTFDPVTPDDFKLAHGHNFVDGVLNGTVQNGFSNTDMAVAQSLPYTTGSMVAAAKHALANKTIACSPTSGFHHAGPNTALGFCTFNGLMVTAMMLKKAGLVDRVAILDCDAHYGNGTDEIIEALGIDWIIHHTQGDLFYNRGTTLNGAYEAWLDHAIDDCAQADLVLYQAGADPHVHDPYGGMLTTHQLDMRDEAVFSRLGHMPLAWNLAGGYQTAPGGTEAERLEPVLALHRSTMKIAIRNCYQS